MESRNKLKRTGVGGGDNGGKRGKGLVKEQVSMTHGMDNRVGIDCGNGGRQGKGEQWGKMGTTVIEQQ